MPEPPAPAQESISTAYGEYFQSSRNSQLPSPISPSTRPSPISSSPIASTSPLSAEAVRNNHLIPIRGFVHEVLRRSRTSTGVLQTALCYLEAVRRKVPDLLHKEQEREMSGLVDDEVDPSSRITLGTAADYEEDAAACFEDGTLVLEACANLGNDFMDVETVQVMGDSMGPPTAPLTEPLLSMDAPEVDAPPVRPTISKKPAEPLPPMPRLPSPLLCPRRTFLACLILASKFMQDRSYSNRAWAKLAGLPPRVIGRCERALGEVLEWRLWVGKGPAMACAPALSAGAHRAVTRCKSEANLDAPTCSWTTPSSNNPAAAFTAHSNAVRAAAATLVSLSGLRRASTMPNIGTSGPSSVASYPTSFASSFAVAGSEGDYVPDAAMLSATSSSFSPAASMGWTNAGSHAISPSLATPTLTYSPASTTSSEDSERASQMSISSDQPTPTVGQDYTKANAFAHGFCSLSAGLKLPAIEPVVVNAPVHLPPISEAIFNPVLLERSVGVHPAYASIGDMGSDSYDAYSMWSVSGRS